MSSKALLQLEQLQRGVGLLSSGVDHTQNVHKLLQRDMRHVFLPELCINTNQ